MSMNSSLAELEKTLGIKFSETFCAFWEDYVPSKTPNFSLKASKLGGVWGYRGYDLKAKRAVIEVEESLESFHKEITIAHEILHLVLEWEGYPLIYSDEQRLKRNLPNAEAIAENLHSVIIHPVIRFRMKEWGFSVDKHIKVKAAGQLKDLETKIDQYPPRSNLPEWCEWLLRYVLARLEWGEFERQAIRDMFSSRHIPIERQGEKYLNRLEKIGYLEPKSLTPVIVTEAGEMFLHLLDLKSYYTIGFISKSAS